MRRFVIVLVFGLAGCGEGTRRHRRDARLARGLVRLSTVLRSRGGFPESVCFSRPSTILEEHP